MILDSNTTTSNRASAQTSTCQNVTLRVCGLQVSTETSFRAKLVLEQELRRRVQWRLQHHLIRKPSQSLSSQFGPWLLTHSCSRRAGLLNVWLTTPIVGLHKQSVMTSARIALRMPQFSYNLDSTLEISELLQLLFSRRTSAVGTTLVRLDLQNATFSRCQEADRPKP